MRLIALKTALCLFAIGLIGWGIVGSVRAQTGNSSELVEINGPVEATEFIMPTTYTPQATARVKTFSEGINDTCQFGYNLSDTLYVPNIFTEPQLWFGFESNYANSPERDPAFGTDPTSEMYLRYMPIGISSPDGYLEPLFCNIDRPENKIIRLDLRSEHTTLAATDWTKYLEMTPSSANFYLPVGINVGEGSIPPQNLHVGLEVNGNILLDGAGHLLKISDMNSYLLCSVAPDGNYGLYYGNDSGTRSLQFWTANAEIMRISGGILAIGTKTPTVAGTGGLDMAGDRFRLRAAHTPTTSAEICNQGEWSWDANYIYVCTSTNNWRRAPLSPF